MRRVSRIGVAALLFATFASCADEPASPSNGLPTRTFRMGFSAIPAKQNEQAMLAALAMWTQRADIAIMHVSVPYKAMLTGTAATTYVNTVELPLANYFRAKGLPIVVTLDVTDGLNRAAEAPELVELGRSITEPVVQVLYRQYALAMASTLRPEYMFLAAETNLIHDVAPAPLYSALVQMVNASANEINALSGQRPQLGVSVQADIGWGRIIHSNVYQGVERDFQDFPFMRVLGLSSYPYFTYPDPDDVPLDYYARLKNGRNIPVIVVEGGWTSGNVSTVQSTPEKQVRYLRRQEKLLDSARAIGVMQLTFTDLDVSSLNLPPGSTLSAFAQLGMVDTELRPKLALATYDSIFARRR